MFKAEESQSETLISNFKNGDLLYGLEKVGNAKGKLSVSGPRERMRNELINQNASLKSNPNCYVTVDELNRKTEYRLSEFLSLSKEGEPAFVKVNELTPAEHDHLHYLKYGKHGYHFKKMFEEDQDETYVRRHICKAIIIKPDVKIHFLLDMIDLKRVASKLHDNKLERAFTASELRFIYRKWNENESLKEKIVFYENVEVIPAPWDEQSDKHHEWQNHFLTTEQAKAAQLSHKITKRPSEDESLPLQEHPKKKAKLTFFDKLPDPPDSKEEAEQLEESSSDAGRNTFAKKLFD